MINSHYLRPMLMPGSVALVGASGKPGSIGRIAMENLLGGDFRGAIYAVNPRHRRVLARRSYASVAAIGKPVDLALVAVPSGAVVSVLDECARAGIRVAIVYSGPPAGLDDERRWRREIAATASRTGIRILGPSSFGVLRTDIGLNATLGTTAARRGRLALLAQSGAVCTAMLEFAASAGIAFSTVAAQGGGIDVGFGELLDVLLHDGETDGILLHAESIGDARRFMSALRAAARTKPVVILKSGRSTDRGAAGGPTPDAVFDAAMQRAGTVRVKTYTQLFAAARMLAVSRNSLGDRLAIVANGYGPGTLAADVAYDRGIALADFSPGTEGELATLLPPGGACRNPLDVGPDATPKRIKAAVNAVLSDALVDAVLVLHVARPAMGGTDAARAVADAARRATKPVLAAWLGSIDRREADAALEAGGVANFYTPENAVEAFSFLSAYRHNQQWLLEVPSPQPEPPAPDTVRMARILADAAAAGRRALSGIETHALLSAFHLPMAPALSADTLNEALAAARRLGYPVSLRSDAPATRAGAASNRAIAGLRDGRMLTRAWAKLVGGTAKGQRRAAVIVARDLRFDAECEVAIGIHVDAVFGPVITLGACRSAGAGAAETLVLMPPLNARLARDFIRGGRGSASLQRLCAAAGPTEALARVLVQVSAVACALPALSKLSLDPVRVGADRAEIAGAHVVFDPRSKPALRPYGHMAIHPYPIEFVADVVLPDGARLEVRPIRPEDAELERAFVNGLSEEARYFRFFYQLHELTPAMLARFTQIDYDREMALIAVDESGPAPEIVGVARYITGADDHAAEFAIVIADRWQRRGVARMMMTRLIACAKGRGLASLEGTVLRSNHTMLKFTASLGFVVRDDPDDQEQVIVTLSLA